jgi:hypothetical protein
MEELNVSAATVVAHILITCIAWLIGIAVGGGLGALCALGMHATFSARPAWRRPCVLLPWRTLVMGLLTVVWSPFVASLLWLGPVTGGVMVAGSVSLLAMALTASTLLGCWHPSPAGSRFVAGARTLGVASSLLAAGVGLLGGGGLGSTILEAARLLQFGDFDRQHQD